MRAMRIFFALFCVFLVNGIASVGFAEVTLTGVFKQGGMVHGLASDGEKIRFKGDDIFIGSDGRFVFGFSRDEGQSVSVEVINADGSVQGHSIVIAPQTYDIERVNGLPPSTVTIPPEEEARRAAEREKIAEARSQRLLKTEWLDGFAMPAEGRISGVYGSQRILNGEPRFPHYGLDVAAPIGTPIFAPAAGYITLAESDFLLEGGIVIIDHGYQIYSTLFHMNSVDVLEGDFVQKGQQIGTIGEKGRASGPHVDWRVNWGNVRLDPALVLTEKQTITLNQSNEEPN